MSKDNKTPKKLAEIKGLLKRAEKQRVVQFLYSLGFAFLVSSLTLIVSTTDDRIKWLILVVGLFFIAVGLRADGKRPARDK